MAVRRRCPGKGKKMSEKRKSVPRMASELDMGTFGITQNHSTEYNGWVTNHNNQMEFWVFWKLGDKNGGGWIKPGADYGGGIPYSPATLVYTELSPPTPINSLSDLCTYVEQHHGKPRHELTGIEHQLGPYITPCP